MTRKYSLFLFALILLLAGLSINSESLVRFLVPQVGQQQLATARLGAAILKAILVVDSLLLFCVGYFALKTHQQLKSYIPMWTGDRPSSQPEPLKQYRPIIIGLILIGLVLRIIGLNSDLWMDEVFTLVESVRPAFGEIISIYSTDNQHTLYSLLAKLSIRFFGEDAWSLRLPALIFGVASIWAIARFARLAFGEREAILATLLCTFSYHHIWFSQNARGYTILLFITLLSTDCFMRGLKTGLWRYWFGYAVLIALGTYAHLTAVFVAIAHALIVVVLLIKERKLADGRWKPMVAIALSAWFSLHLYSLTVPQLFEFFGTSGTGTGQVSVEWQNPLWLVTETLQQVGISVTAWWPLLIVVFAMCGWAGYLFVRRDWVLTSAAFLPAVLTALVLLGLERNLWPRLFFHEIGFVAVFAGATLVAAANYVKVRITPDTWLSSFGISLIPAMALCLASVTTYKKLYMYPKQDYRAARDFVQQVVGPTDKVLGLHMAGRVYHSYYEPDWPEINTVEEILSHQSNGGYTWVLYTLPRFVEQAKPELASMLEEKFDLVRIFPGSLNDGEIIVKRSKSLKLEQL